MSDAARRDYVMVAGSEDMLPGVETSEFYSKPEVADLLGVDSKNALNIWMLAGRFPRPTVNRGQKGVFWLRSVVDEWISDVERRHGRPWSGRQNALKLTRTDYEMRVYKGAILRVLNEQEKAVTLRRLYYLLVAANIIDKTDGEYMSLSHHMTEWREAEDGSGAGLYDKIIDTARAFNDPYQETDLWQVIQWYAEDLKAQPWTKTPYHVEVWLEKDTLYPLIEDVAAEYRVPVLVSRGQYSTTICGEAAKRFHNRMLDGRKVKVFYIGDSDPDGESIDPAAVDHVIAAAQAMGLRPVPRDFLERVAVLRPQIKTYNLITRETKSKSATARAWLRAHKHDEGKGESVEVEAMNPGILVGLLRDHITGLLKDHTDAWRKALDEEALVKAEILAKVE